MIQSYRLDEEGFRGGRTFNHDQKGNNDLLNLTRPEVVGEICNAYLDAGADIVATNTFNSNAISLSDYGITGMAREINIAALEGSRLSAALGAAAEASRSREPLSLRDQLAVIILRIQPGHPVAANPADQSLLFPGLKDFLAKGSGHKNSILVIQKGVVFADQEHLPWRGDDGTAAQRISLR